MSSLVVTSSLHIYWSVKTDKIHEPLTKENKNRVCKNVH